MIRINIDLASQGMITAKNIFSTDGTLLLPEYSVLTRNSIERLKKAGFDTIYVQNPHMPDIEPFDRDLEKIKVDASGIIQQECRNLRSDEKIHLPCIYSITEKVIENLLNHKNLLIHLTDIRAHDDYTFGHSVNVCILSVMTGIKIGYSDGQLYELSVGTLLHDLGKLLIPKNILEKPARLSHEEWKIIRQHVKLGHELIMDKPGQVPQRSANIVLQHHENFNCKGYPNGLCSEEIDEYAKIAAVADMYDAITASRTYRRASYQHDAYHSILAAKGTRLDPRIADIFMNNIAKYPIGSVVLLSTSETGTVIESFTDFPDRPVVKIIADDYKNALSDGRTIDLRKESDIAIIRILDADEVFSIGK